MRSELPKLAVTGSTGSTYTAIVAGELADVTHHVLALTGRPPASLADHLQHRKD